MGVKLGRNKYRAVKTEYAGLLYDSKAEAARAMQLDLMVRAGLIRFWVRQVTFRLGCPENVYRADFLVVASNGDAWAEDVKGMRTAKFARDIRLWRAYGPCELHIISGKKIEVIQSGQEVKDARAQQTS